MKIYILGPANPYRGGIAKFDEVLADNFSKEGHEVKIINFTLQYPSFLFPGQTQYTRVPPPPGLDIQRMVNSINPFNWCRVGRRIKKERPDLLIVRFWMPFFGPSLGKIAGIVRKNRHSRIVALADNIVPHEHRTGDRTLTRYFLKRMDAVLYMSEEVGRDLDGFQYKGLKALSPHPIYDNYGERVDKTEACRHLNLDPAMNYILFFGFIREYKGLDLLLRAWSILKREGKTEGKRLLVGGEYYGNKEKYDRLLHELDLADDVVVHDSYIDEGRVKYYFSVADLVVQPYKSATQSGVTQVAYHFGVPMIVTNVGGLSEIVPDGKVGYVVGCEPKEIAAAIARFYDEQKDEEFKRNIETEKKRFAWEALTAKFVELTQQIQKEK